MTTAFEAVIYALYYTWPMWAFLALLSLALFVEEGIKAYSLRKMVDNPTLW
jgi:hypothetical protein